MSKNQDQHQTKSKKQKKYGSRSEQQNHHLPQLHMHPSSTNEPQHSPAPDHKLDKTTYEKSKVKLSKLDHLPSI
ncbi:Hypothetical predicted protein [Paramuricea clavata]|uniref:Uncharacterized protein n=1 Tax=Paramuricea clavata TaxID=317549 RepID=A0A6S7G1I1_PARCT|nr:Hypothetical predicted protein [Paramuricea clavata]